MKRQVNLDTGAVKHVVATLGDAWGEASIPVKRSLEYILKIYFGVESGEKALALATKKYNAMLRSEEIRWNRERDRRQ